MPADGGVSGARQRDRQPGAVDEQLYLWAWSGRLSKGPGAFLLAAISFEVLRAGGGGWGWWKWDRVCLDDHRNIKKRGKLARRSGRLFSFVFADWAGLAFTSLFRDF